MTITSERLNQATDDKITIPTGALTTSMLPPYERFISYRSFLPGESITSWFIRLSSANMISRKTILNSVGFMANSMDFDINLSKQELAIVESFLKTPQERFFSREAMAILASLFEVSNTKLLTRHNGLPVFRFCPLCLADGEPHFKAKWRLSFYVVCEKHHHWMLNACDCGQLLNLTKSPTRTHDSPYEYYVSCVSCGRDLREVEVRYAQKTDRIGMIKNRQNRLWKIVLLRKDRLDTKGSSHTIEANEALSRYLHSDNKFKSPAPKELSYKKLFDGQVAEQVYSLYPSPHPTRS